MTADGYGKGDGMKKRGNGSKKSVLALLVLCMFAGMGMQAHAAEDATVGTLYEVTANTGVKEAADAGSATVGELQAGTAVIVESEEDGWSRVLYQELEGYVESGVLEVYAEEELDSLAQEMDGVAQEEQRYVEEAELAARQRRTSLIWGIVIAALILAIFGLGIVSAVKNAKEEEQKEDGGAGDEKKEVLEIEDMDEEESTDEEDQTRNEETKDTEPIEKKEVQEQ